MPGWTLAQPAFRDGSYTTGFVAQHFRPEELRPPLADGDRAALLAAAALFEQSRRQEGGLQDSGTAEAGPSSAWRLAALRDMTGRR